MLDHSAAVSTANIDDYGRALPAMLHDESSGYGWTCRELRPEVRTTFMPSGDNGIIWAPAATSMAITVIGTSSGILLPQSQHIGWQSLVIGTRGHEVSVAYRLSPW
jgi:hypothetical protein